MNAILTYMDDYLMLHAHFLDHQKQFKQLNRK